MSHQVLRFGMCFLDQLGQCNRDSSRLKSNGEESRRTSRKRGNRGYKHLHPMVETHLDIHVLGPPSLAFVVRHRAGRRPGLRTPTGSCDQKPGSTTYVRHIYQHHQHHPARLGMVLVHQFLLQAPQGPSSRHGHPWGTFPAFQVWRTRAALVVSPPRGVPTAVVSGAASACWLNWVGQLSPVLEFECSHSQAWDEFH